MPRVLWIAPLLACILCTEACNDGSNGQYARAESSTGSEPSTDRILFYKTSYTPFKVDRWHVRGPIMGIILDDSSARELEANGRIVLYSKHADDRFSEIFDHHFVSPVIDKQFVLPSELFRQYLSPDEIHEMSVAFLIDDEHGNTVTYKALSEVSGTSEVGYSLSYDEGRTGLRLLLQRGDLDVRTQD